MVPEDNKWRLLGRHAADNNCAVPGAPVPKPNFVAGQPVIVRRTLQGRRGIGQVVGIGHMANGYDSILVLINGKRDEAYAKDVCRVDDTRNHKVEAVRLMAEKSGVELKTRKMTNVQAEITVHALSGRRHLVRDAAFSQGRKGELVLRIGARA